LFEIIGEALSKAEDEAPALRMRIPELGDIIDMRNRIAHGYDEVDNELIWSTATDKVPDLCTRLERVLEDDPIN
jgi:uncharacterized protein with HEPN domain